MSEATRYGDWGKEKTGWFFGLSGGQLAVVVFTGGPALLAIGAQRWGLFLVLLLVWAVVIALTVLPVRGRAAFRWFTDLMLVTVGGVMGWTLFISRAVEGDNTGDLGTPDLPGSMAGLAMFDGPAYEATGSRPVLIQDKGARCWKVTAKVTHPGIGLAEQPDRNRMGAGLAELAEVVARSELISTIAVQIRTVADTGAARQAWVRDHLRPDAHPVPMQINAEDSRIFSDAAVMHEAFVTVVVPEQRIKRKAKEAGGGVDGRARVLYGAMREVSAALVGRIGCTHVAWLAAPGLAGAIRTGYAPGDAAVLDAAHQARRAGRHQVADGQPFAAAGPSRAPTPATRHYVHDAWSTVSCAVLLPDQGAIMGALAPLFTPSTVGERRSATVFYEALPRTRAEREVGRADTSAETGRELSNKLGFKQRARSRRDASRISGQDEKLARGRAMVRVAVVGAVTVPSEWSASDYGGRLESSIRGAGFTPLRLDLAQPAGFVAACIPVGIGLPRQRGRR